MNSNRVPLRRGLALGAAAVLALAACGSDDDADPAGDVVSIDDPWSREPVDGQSVSAVYGVISNDGDELVRAVAATSPVTDSVELHEVVMNDDGEMSMREKDGGYEIPAGGSISLEPGGFHIMMLEIDPAEYPDDVPVTIEFDDGSTFEFDAEVRAIAGMDMDHDDGEMDMDDGEMHDGAMDDEG
ncbi:MAG: copper chaperone PCu(A)C [Actinomycetota bacterium]